MVAHSMYADSPTSAALRDGRVPVYTSIEAAVRALAGLRAGPPAVGRAAAAGAADGPIEPGYFGSRALLAAAGIPVCPRRARAHAARRRMRPRPSSATRWS